VAGTDGEDGVGNSITSRKIRRTRSGTRSSTGLRRSTDAALRGTGRCSVESEHRDSQAAPTVTGTHLGYARVSTEHQSLDQQTDALAAAGVESGRVYSDKLSGTSTRQQRPGLAALLDYAREGDAIVVVGIDRLGRNAAEVMTTIRELGEREIVLRSLREGIDTSNATGRMVAGGRPKALDQSKVALAQRMHASGESAGSIASALGVSRATVYRALGGDDATGT
jgi:DNA invertase Pin-like site-specific DNA recombinase